MPQPIDLHRVRDRIRAFLDRLSDGLPKGRFRFCLEGSLAPTEGRAGAFCSAFAARIALLTGIWNEWDAEQQSALTDFLIDFQQADGFFKDTWLMSQLEDTPEDYRHRVLRAETRQSTVILEHIPRSPKHPLPGRIHTSADIETAFTEEDWTKPWGAGSHFSHELFFLAMNAKYFSNQLDTEGIHKVTTSCLQSILDSQSGTWFSGARDDEQAINGAMKILSGLYWINLDQASEELLHFAAHQPARGEGCGFFNRLFVLERAKHTSKKTVLIDQIQEIALHSLQDLERFEHPDGGYSMYPDLSQTVYYGAPVSEGKACADLHGTMMAAWSIATALRLLESYEITGAEDWMMVYP